MPYRLIAHLLMTCWSLCGKSLQAQQRVKAGNARRWLPPQGGEPSASPPPRREVRGLQLSVPTNQRLSGRVLGPTAQPLDAQPLAGREVVSSFRKLLPLKQARADGRRDNQILCSQRVALKARFSDSLTLSAPAGRRAYRAL